MQPTTAYLCLLAAIVFEVTGTLLLPASQNFTNAKATISLVLLYGVSFYFLSIVVNFIPIAIMYATWSGLGIFTLALVSYFAFNQSLNFWSVIGLALIVIGVVLVNINITLPKKITKNYFFIPCVSKRNPV